MTELIYGVVVGIVKDVKDPLKMGRIKLELPALGFTSDWARISTPMAGKERGFQFMPELEDEVLVSFEQGDKNRPYVLGYLWGGVDQPPQKEEEEQKKRTLKTVSGHLLEFDDKDGSEKITLKFKGGDPSITMEQDKMSIMFNSETLIELSAGSVKIKATLIEFN